MVVRKCPTRREITDDAFWPILPRACGKACSVQMERERPACRAVERLRARRKTRTELLPWLTPRETAWPTGAAALEDDEDESCSPNYRQIRQDAVAASPDARTRSDLLPWHTPREEAADGPIVGAPADEPVTFVWRTQLDDDSSAQSSWRTQDCDDEDEVAQFPWRWQTAVASPRLKAAIVIAERDTPRGHPEVTAPPAEEEEEEEEAGAVKLPQGPPPKCCEVCGGLFSSPVCRCSGMALSHPIERILTRQLSPRPAIDDAEPLSPSLHRSAKRSRRWKEGPPPAPPPPPPQRWASGDPALLA